MLQPKENVVRSLLKPSTVLGIASGAVAWGILAGLVGPAHAEGSRSLYPASTPPGSFRANLEWRGNVLYAGILTRRTLLRVYANAGETIFVGSSAVGVAAGDILIYPPGSVPDGPYPQGAIPGTPVFQCSNQRATTGNAAQGFIGTRAQELAGPQSPNNPAGYVPCTFTAPASGIYPVVITGPDGLNSPADVPPTGSLNPIQADVSQRTTVSAWDVTVRSSPTADDELPGRLFTYYLSLFTGANGRPVQGSLFALTTDGYRYQTDLGGIDPNGFVVYGNRQGFLDGNNIPINHDLVAGGGGNADQLDNPQGGVTIALPEFPLFFADPSPEARRALGIPDPIAPIIAQDSFTFTGTAGANNSLFGTGGTFSYQTNVPHVFEIIISRDGTNFDPTAAQNRVLRGVRDSAGASTITWDGLDNSGQPFPVGQNYPARLTIRGGEYHFPLLDVENSPFGSPTFTLLNAPGPNCFTGNGPPGSGGPCRGAFYDDRGYRTSDGQQVGTINQPLPGGAPAVPNSNFETGFDTSPPSDRAFIGFGDKKGLDLWTYYPSPTLITPLNIVAPTDANLSLRKVAVNPSVSVGQNVTFIITLTNNGPATATNVTVSDQLPAGLSFVSATPSQGTFDAATGVWTVGTLAVNTSVTLEITATLTTSDPVANIAQVTNSDQRDPNSTPNNSVPTEDDQATATLGQPNLRLVKRITAATRSGVPTTFTDFVDDPTDPNDTVPGWTQAQFSPVGVPNIPSSQPLRSGDEVEYTIYFLSDGSQPALDVSLCDQVPPLTTLIAGSPVVQQGNANPAPGGAVFSALAPLPSGNSCQEQTNPNGSVIFTFPQISNAAGSNFGFVRIRVRIN